ncbi:lipopolysaccharide biosynthesis protein [Mesorhizobium sp. Root157]|uniref:glycosyltransferase family 2 protein n=1 Tax=Mesorhizobium sp. Root157 TaxID=1736477 RepID=UPI0007006AAE|nr:glycosyltransferase family 2 protein [Mesorhizobium sp. Root157]KQZ87138.1 lipopolysaccharide biosynthesis protein [Mesorhizobium sp. Root157]
MQRTEKPPVSAFIICKNEVSMIGPCIESLDVCREIVIVDSGSTDGTIELIETYRDKGYPIRLFQRDWPGYAKQKQFALDQCTETWCLNLDCDERLDDALKLNLPELISTDQTVAAWELDFRLFLLGYGYTPDRVRLGHLVRLVRKGRVHYRLNQLVHEGVDVEGEIGTNNKGKILHARPISIEEHISKLNQYSGLKSTQLFNSGKNPRLFRLIFNPFIYFIRIFIFRRFYLCGWAGFIHAGTGAIYSFLTEAKLYQMHAKARGDKSQS